MRFYERMQQKIMLALTENLPDKINGKEIYTHCSFGCQGYDPPNKDDAGIILTFEDGKERYLVLVQKMD